MKQFFFIAILIWSLSSYSQSGFQFPEGVDKIEIPFQATYNLIVVPTIVNGVELNMILDTGASKSIIFNFSNIDSLSVKRGELLKVGGYGKEDFYNAYYSQFNTIELNGYKNKNASLFIAAEKEVNLEPTIGITVNGLLGADFFQEALVEVDYLKELIVLHRDEKTISSTLKNMNKISLKIIDNKPYLKGTIYNGKSDFDVEFLVDSGNGDATWLFDLEKKFNLNNKSFQDYLGIGINGETYGKRSKLKSMKIDSYELFNVTVSVPFRDNTNNIVDKNTGSIGGEILSRFKIIFDYKNSFIYLKPNDNLTSGFFYNMAGINLKAGEKELFVKSVVSELNGIQLNQKNEGSLRKSISKSKLEYVKLPKIYVDQVIAGSPAEKAGIKKGDEIIKINFKEKGEFSLDDVASKFYKNPFSKIRLKIKRGKRFINFRFKLIPII